MSDIRLAFRSLRRRPGFAAAAIATLALGIGASTAIFSVAYGVSLRPMPYPEPDRLIRIYEANPLDSKLKENATVAAFHAWREGAPSIESAALFTKVRARFLDDPDQTPFTSMGVSPAFFDVLGVRPMLGSGFRPEREYTPATAREVVLSFAAWHRLFGGDRRVVGRPIRFADDDDAHQIVGVMPAGFAFLDPVDVWQPKIVDVPIRGYDRRGRDDRVVARLRREATIDRARAELEGVAARLAREFPVNYGGWTVSVESLHDSVVGTFARAAWLLLAAVGVVLLVTCLNVGGLFVARAVARERETAIRLALGAGAWRLLRSWLAEAALLSALGTGGGLLLAWTGVLMLKAAAPPGIPRLESVAINVPTLAVATLASLLAVAILTVTPAGRRRRELASLLRGSGGAGEPGGRQRARAALTIAQCAGAATLVVLAMMLTRSFVRLMSFDLGWNSARVLSMSVSPPRPSRTPWYWYVEWSDRLIARLEATPGVERAAVTTQIPLSPDASPSTLAKGRGKTASDDSRWPGVQHHVTDGYFALMDIRIVSGRTFGKDDRFAEPYVNRSGTAERGVAVVSASTARALWPNQRAVGQILWMPEWDSVKWREVVGVVEDVQFHAIGESPALHVFLPWTQTSTGRPRLLVRSARGAEASMTGVVRDVVRTVEPGTKIDRTEMLDTLVARATAQPRFTTQTVAAFGGLALALAAVGIYGTLAYVVGARTREIGVRLALGATRGRIVASVLWRAMVPAIVGGTVGLLAAIALARAFQSLLFHVQPLDPASVIGGATLLLVVALAAAAGPALRASRVDPAHALRTD